MNDGGLQRRSEQIEALLDDIEGSAGPRTLARVEELVRLLLDLYGTGLTRMLAHIGAEPGGEQRVRALCTDELLAGLFVLHGIHPEGEPEPVRDHRAGDSELVVLRRSKHEGAAGGTG